jgi:hypothetical protein
MKKKYINPTAQAIQLEINPLLDNVQSVQNLDPQPGENVGGNTTPSKGFSISNDGPEYDEEL